MNKRGVSIGIIVGVVVGLIILAVVGYFLMSKPNIEVNTNSESDKNRSVSSEIKIGDKTYGCVRNISDYLIAGYNQQNWERECEELNGKQVCIYSINFDYSNGNTIFNINLLNIDTERENYFDYLLEDSFKDQTIENVYKIRKSTTLQSEVENKIAWSSNEFDIIIIKQYKSERAGMPGDVLGSFSAEVIDMDNPVVIYFLDNFPPQSITISRDSESEEFNNFGKDLLESLVSCGKIVGNKAYDGEKMLKTDIEEVKQGARIPNPLNPESCLYYIYFDQNLFGDPIENHQNISWFCKTKCNETGGVPNQYTSYATDSQRGIIQCWCDQCPAKGVIAEDFEFSEAKCFMSKKYLSDEISGTISVQIKNTGGESISFREWKVHKIDGLDILVSGHAEIHVGEKAEVIRDIFKYDLGTTHKIELGLSENEVKTITVTCV